VQGNLVFDPLGGGAYAEGLVINGGHVWFPTFERVKELLEISLFAKYCFFFIFTVKMALA
jgi:hypothetical protein